MEVPIFKKASRYHKRI